MSRYFYVKHCACGATSTTGAVRLTTRFDRETMSHKMKLTHYPMPSCDECGEPWTMEHKQDQESQP